MVVVVRGVPAFVPPILNRRMGHSRRSVAAVAIIVVVVITVGVVPEGGHHPAEGIDIEVER